MTDTQFTPEMREQARRTEQELLKLRKFLADIHNPDWNSEVYIAIYHQCNDLIRLMANISLTRL